MILSEEKTQEEIKEILEDTIDIKIPKLEDFNFIKERKEKC